MNSKTAMSTRRHRHNRKRQHNRKPLWLMVLAMLAMAAGSTPVQAATFSVTNTSDNGAGSLRQAVTDANSATGADTITFASSVTGTITLTSAQLPAIADDLTISGPGAATLSVSGNNAVRHFTVNSGVNFTLENLTLLAGRVAGGSGADAFGGALFNNGGAVVITGCAFSSNQALGGFGSGGFYPGGNGGNGGAAYGGAIYSSGGSLAVSYSTFDNNYAAGGGGGAGGNGLQGSGGSSNGPGGNGGNGGYGYGGAIYSSNGLSVTNCTFAANTVAGGAGGSGAPGGFFYTYTYSCGFQTCTGSVGPGAPGGGGNGGWALGGTLNASANIINSTISGGSANGSAPGGGPGPSGSPGNGMGANLFGGMSLRNTIVSAPNGAGNCSGSVNDNGSNISSDGSCSLNTSMGSLNNTNPLLSALNTNGGPTRTMALQSGSPAIDAGTTVLAPATDQRKYLRVGAPDIGAYEFGASPLLAIDDISVTEGQSSTVNATFTVSLDATSSQTVTVDYATADGTATVSAGDYNALSGTLSFAPGETSKVVTILVSGDTGLEPDETFTVNLSNAVNAVINDGQGSAAILNDDPEAPSLIVTTDIDNSTNMDGLTSLREAIAFANSNPNASAITFDTTFFNSAKTITVGGGFTLSENVTITGPPAGVTVAGVAGAGGPFTIFTVNTAVSAGFHGVTIRNGVSGISNGGTLTVTGSTLRGNSNSGIANNGVATLTNSTLSGNTNAGLDNAATATVTITNCTISGNAVGIDNDGTATLKNSLVVGNTTANIGGSNPVTAGADSITTGTAAAAGLDPAGLQDNGGPTHTIALTTAGTALDGGNNAYATGLTTDQRGPGFARILGGTVDIGAVEAIVPRFNISGRVADAAGAAISGAGVVRSGNGSTPVTTNGAGYYTLTNVPAGAYVVTVTKSNYTFAPVSRNVTVSNANIGYQNFTGKTGINLSGRISNSYGAPIAGVTLLRTGSSTPVTTNSAGYYTFIGVPAGSTTITPSKNGYRFTPVNKTVTVSTSDISGQNFIGATGYNIAGRIANSSGVGQSGISVGRSGSNVAVQTNSAGYYTFTDVPNGSVTITPGGAGLSFSPASRTVTMNSADIAGQNFTSAPGYNVIGRITTSGGAALAGVAVARSGSSTAVLTNSAGYFVFSGVAAGSYTLTPTLNGYSFTPVTRTVAVTNADVGGQNFIGTSP